MQVSHLGQHTGSGSPRNTLLTAQISLKKENQTIIRSEKESFLVAEAGSFRPHSGLGACPSMVTRTLQDGVTAASTLPGVSFAAERWKGFVPTPTGGGEAPSTGLSSVSPRPPQTEMQIAPGPRGSQAAAEGGLLPFLPFLFYFFSGSKI